MKKNYFSLVILLFLCSGIICYAQDNTHPIQKASLFEKAAFSWDNIEEPSYINEKYYTVDTEKSIEDISKILRSLSTMKGIKYYSTTHKKEEVLYHDCHFIKSLEDKTYIPDDLSGSADGKSFYYFQKDNSLGLIYYKVDYAQTEDQVLLTFTLAEPLKVGFVTGIKSGNFKINVLTYKQDDKLHVYILGQCKYQNVPFVEERSNKSFNARIDAIYSWFVSQL